MRNDTDKLVEAVRQDIINDDVWTDWPGGWPGQIEMCLVDSIYSANANYGSHATETRAATGVRGVLARLKALRQVEVLDDLAALAGLLRSGPTPVLGNSQQSPGTSVLKEQNVLLMTEAFAAADVTSSDDLERYLAESTTSAGSTVWWPRHPEHGRIAGVADQTWEYFRMLAGHTGVKADRMIRRYVARATGTSVDKVDPKTAASLVRRAAATLGHQPHQLDHAIWSYERTTHKVTDAAPTSAT